MIKLTPPCRPLLNDRAVEFLASVVKPRFRVFEFGSGASTVWFAERVKSIVSVESDPAWREAVCVALEEAGLWALTLLVEVYNQQSGEDYANQIIGFPAEHFDLVFVDGKARPHCIKEARPKVKRGGWMVLDDLQYQPVRTSLYMLDEWEKVAEFRGRVLGAVDGLPRTNTTGFWRKV